jgi:hypothetical protein
VSSGAAYELHEYGPEDLIERVQALYQGLSW